MESTTKRNDLILVRRGDLQDYVEEYHNPNTSDRCKADGQVWPCNTITALREALKQEAPEGWASTA